MRRIVLTEDPDTIQMFNTWRHETWTTYASQTLGPPSNRRKVQLECNLFGTFKVSLSNPNWVVYEGKDLETALVRFDVASLEVDMS